MSEQVDVARPAREKAESCRPGDCPGERPLSLPRVDDAIVRSIARVHKALSDETRLRILMYLTTGELCVCELLGALEMPQSTVSHHLMLLQNADLITSRKQGRWVLYSINHEVFDRCNPFCEKE